MCRKSNWVSSSKLMPSIVSELCQKVHTQMKAWPYKQYPSQCSRESTDHLGWRWNFFSLSTQSSVKSRCSRWSIHNDAKMFGFFFPEQLISHPATCVSNLKLFLLMQDTSHLPVLALLCCQTAWATATPTPVTAGLDTGSWAAAPKSQPRACPGIHRC